MKNISIKLNANLRGYKKGQILKIPVNKNNEPTDLYWRRRFNDATIDNCIEVVKPQKKQENN